MSVIRVKKNRNYTVMSNAHLRDKELSLKAKGLLSVALSLPDDWEYSLSGLSSICKENITAIRSAINELQNMGYVKVEKLYPEKEAGRNRIEYSYTFFESKQDTSHQDADCQDIENLHVEHLHVEDRMQINTNTLNIDKSTTEKTSTDKPNTIHAFNPSEKSEGLKEIHASCCHTKPVSAPKKKRVGYLKPGEFTADDLYKHLYQRSLRYCLHNGKDEYDARDFARVIHYFYMAYKNKMGHDHPFLNDGAFERVADAYFHPPEYIFDGDLTSVDNYAMMIDRFLETNFGERKKNEYGYGNEIETDPTISLFMSSEFREHIAMHLFEEP